MDYGTRLKAVFTNIPAGVTLYVSTANAAGYTIPGGTNTAPYAVLVANSQSNEATNDGPPFTPLASAVTGSDGLSGYPLTPDILGQASAIWEVVNSNPHALDVLTFSVYIAYTGTPSTPSLTDVSLSYAPEPGGSTFPTLNATQGLTAPAPRFAVARFQGGSWATVTSCTLQASGPLEFVYTLGGEGPSSATVAVFASPSTLPVTVTPMVTTPAGGNWLTASYSNGILTASAHPTGLAPSSTAYTGNVKLSASGVSDVLVPVTLTVYPPRAALSIGKTHTASFMQGQAGATYVITVSNGPSADYTNGLVTVTEQIPSGLTLVSMVGTKWDCSALPACTRRDTLAPGAAYEPIVVTVNVSQSAPSQVSNQVSVSGGTSPNANAVDVAPVSTVCAISGVLSTDMADVQHIIDEALGILTAAHDLNHDGVINIADVQKEINSALGLGCPF